MQIKIGTKTFEADPYLINEKYRKQAKDDEVYDPMDPFDDPLSYSYRKRSITAVDFRLINSERRKIYEYNCRTRRGDTFGLDASGNLMVPPVIYYFAQRPSKYQGKKHPYWEIKTKKTKELAKAFRAAVGMPEKLGMSDPNQDVDNFLKKWGGETKISPSWKRKADSLIPNFSFEIYVHIEFAYFRLKFGDVAKGDHVLIGLPRTVTPAYQVTHACFAESYEELEMVGDEKKGGKANIGKPVNLPEISELRVAYDAALRARKEREDAQAREAKVERLKKKKKRLEESIERLKEDLEKTKEQLEQDGK